MTEINPKIQSSEIMHSQHSPSVSGEKGIREEGAKVMERAMAKPGGWVDGSKSEINVDAYLNNPSVKQLLAYQRQPLTNLPNEQTNFQQKSVQPGFQGDDNSLQDLIDSFDELPGPDNQSEVKGSIDDVNEFDEFLNELNAKSDQSAEAGSNKINEESKSEQLHEELAKEMTELDKDLTELVNNASIDSESKLNTEEELDITQDDELAELYQKREREYLQGAPKRLLEELEADLEAESKVKSEPPEEFSDISTRARRMNAEDYTMMPIPMPKSIEEGLAKLHTMYDTKVETTPEQQSKPTVATFLSKLKNGIGSHLRSALDSLKKGIQDKSPVDKVDIKSVGRRIGETASAILLSLRNKTAEGIDLEKFNKADKKQIKEKQDEIRQKEAELQQRETDLNQRIGSKVISEDSSVALQAKNTIEFLKREINSLQEEINFLNQGIQKREARSESQSETPRAALKERVSTKLPQNPPQLQDNSYLQGPTKGETQAQKAEKMRNLFTEQFHI